MEEARYYARRDGGAIACALCPHLCALAPGERGRCEARENIGGVLYTYGAGEATLLEPRPIEWLPLYHFAPGASLLFVGSVGQSFPAELLPPQAPSGEEGSRWVTSAEVVDLVVGQRLQGVAAIGGDPFVWFEQWLALATASRAEPSRRLINAALTNGYASEEAAREIAPLLDAVHLVLLGPEAAYTRRGLALEPVLRTAAILAEHGCHLEASLLVLRGENTGREQVLAFADLIEARVRPSALHITSPVDAETAAPVAAVHQVYDLCSDRLPFVYLGQTYSTHGSEPTRCSCGRTLVERGARSRALVGANGTCPDCGRASPIRLA